MPYKGPGFYNELGERVCSLHPESMQTFIDSQGFAHVQNLEEYEFLEDDVIEQARRDLKNELYGPRKQYHLDSTVEENLEKAQEEIDELKKELFSDKIKWGGTD